MFGININIFIENTKYFNQIIVFLLKKRWITILYTILERRIQIT